MFALIFWPHVTIFCIFWLHKCLKWILEFNSKSLFWCQSRRIFEVRAIEQRHHEFQLIHMPPHQFWPRYHSDGLSPVHVRFEFFSKQICNVEALICHFYKNIKTLTQIHFPRDAHIFRTCTIFYRHYKGLHQIRKDLVLCALDGSLPLYKWDPCLEISCEKAPIIIAISLDSDLRIFWSLKQKNKNVNFMLHKKSCSWYVTHHIKTGQLSVECISRYNTICMGKNKGNKKNIRLIFDHKIAMLHPIYTWVVSSLS